MGTVIILVLALLGYALGQRPAEPPQQGDPVPGFRLVAFDGTPMELDAQRGRVVVVNFFASWCAPCRQEAADLELVWRDYGPQGVQFFGIGYKDAKSKAMAFLDEFNVSYPSTVDPANRIARSYGVTGVPETFILDRDGLLARHFLGPVTRADLQWELDRLLAASP